MNYLRKVILDTITFRKDSNFVRHDMIDLIIASQKGILDSGFATLPKESYIGKLSSRKGSEKNLNI